MTVMIRSSESLLTEPDMERMARSGAERSCWRIMGILQDSEVLPRFTDGGRCFCKRGLAYCGLYDLRIYERSQRAWEIMETLGLCSEQESRVQFTMADRKINAVASTSAGRLLMPSVRYSGSGAGQDLKGKHRRHCSLQQRHTSSRTSQISHRSKGK